MTTPKKEVQKVLDGLYEEHLGTSTGPVAKALNAMNHEIGPMKPRVVLVQNLYDKEWDNIPPKGFGVVRADQMARRLKKVAVIKEEKKDA